MDVTKAIATLREQQLRQADPDPALALVLKEVIRYRRALRHYAEPAHWIDNEVFFDGDLRSPDLGMTARVALRLVDFAGEPVIREEGKTDEREAA